MEYLTADHIIYINETQVGPGQLRDRKLLESAVGRPQQTWGGEDLYPDIHTKAAALNHSLIRNHPFMDGNKRTAFLADVAFYGVNGYAFEAPQTDVIHFMVDIATKDLDDIDEIGQRLSRWTKALPE